MLLSTPRFLVILTGALSLASTAFADSRPRVFEKSSDVDAILQAYRRGLEDCSLYGAPNKAGARSRFEPQTPGERNMDSRYRAANRSPERFASEGSAFEQGGISDSESTSEERSNARRSEAAATAWKLEKQLIEDARRIARDFALQEEKRLIARDEEIQNRISAQRAAADVMSYFATRGAAHQFSEQYDSGNTGGSEDLAARDAESEGILLSRSQSLGGGEGIEARSLYNEDEEALLVRSLGDISTRASEALGEDGEEPCEEGEEFEAVGGEKITVVETVVARGTAVEGEGEVEARETTEGETVAARGAEETETQEESAAREFPATQAEPLHAIEPNFSIQSESLDAQVSLKATDP